MPLVKVYDALTVFKYLNGIINVFKPAGMKTSHVRKAIIYNLCRDLNELEVRASRKLEKLPLLQSGGAADPVVQKISETIDLSDHILPTSARYQMQDIRCALVAGLGTHTSGVLLFGLNNGLKQSSRIQSNRPLRVYHVTGRLGVATETYLPNSHITVKANYQHVNPNRISSLAASLQASHQRKMYELCGVDLQSQAAYEIACKGLIRPANNTQPVVYGIKLIEFKRPFFTLEIHTANESESYLATFVHEMGIELHTVAHCTELRCVRHAYFDVENALLRHNWNLQSVLENMQQQQKIIKAHPYLLKQDKVELRNS